MIELGSSPSRENRQLTHDKPSHSTGNPERLAAGPRRSWTLPSPDRAAAADSRRLQLITGSRQGTHLQLDLVWTGDRFAQQMRWMLAGRPWATLESVEGDATERWPPSPPWQQIVPHPGPDPEASPVLLAVGMAGSSHWSASLEAEDILADAVPRLRWDIACRVHERPQRLGNVFRWIKPPSGSAAPIRLEQLVSAYLLGPTPAHIEVHSIDDRLQVQLELDASSVRLPTTVRWQLELAFPLSRLP